MWSLHLHFTVRLLLYCFASFTICADNSTNTTDTDDDEDVTFDTSIAFKFYYQLVDSSDMTARGYYKFHEIPVEWEEARRICRLEGAELIAPANIYARQIVKFLLTDLKDDQRVYTGFHSRYLGGSVISIKGVKFHNVESWWAEDEPSKGCTRYYAIAIDKNGNEYVSNFTNRYPFICYIDFKENEIRNPCETLDEMYNEQFQSSCYKYHNNPQPWHEAAATCVGEGAHLVVINGEEEASIVKKLTAKFSSTKYNAITGATGAQSIFAGFYQHSKTSEWLTVLNEAVIVVEDATWGKNHPPKPKKGVSCGRLDNGVRYAEDCTKRFPFVCEMPYLE